MWADNNNNFFGKVRLSESPLFLDLSFRETKLGARSRVGTFRLDLPKLLQGGFIRHAPIGSQGDHVLLRIVYYPETGEFFVQTKKAGPKAPLTNPGN